MKRFNYETKTTFWDDFSIAECCALAAIHDTYERAFNEWRDNYIYLTELVMVLNWKCWDWYEKDNLTLSEIYQALYYETADYAIENLKGEELTYYFRTTD